MRGEMGSGVWGGGRQETTRPKTTSSPKNHKLAQKPQARQKTTSPTKNHKPDKKPQARQKTTSSPKNHKLAQKPQARPKTTSPTKNHKPDKKPQARQKTTSSPKNHKPDKKPHHMAFAVFVAVCGRNSSLLACSALRAHDTHSPWTNAHARGFWRLFPFLTRNALRAIQKPQAIHKTTKPHARTTSDPQAKNREK